MARPLYRKPAVTSSTTDVTQASIIAAWVNLLVAISLLNGGNLLLDDVAKDTGIALHLFASPIFFLAIACLGSAFLFYVRSLARLPLAVAYPVMVGVSLIVVAIANCYWLGTNLAPTQLLGILALFLGVVLIVTTSRSA
jgi:multidrug transporter EmrE-like cation transporter